MIASKNKKKCPIYRWIHQIRHRDGQLHWKEGNISFGGQTIKSYGWWPMAILWNLDRKVALYRSETYSISTSRHLSYVWRALQNAGYRVFTVPVIKMVLSAQDHSKNLESYEDRIGRKLELADRSRTSKPWHMEAAQKLVAEMQAYIVYFGLDIEP